MIRFLLKLFGYHPPAPITFGSAPEFSDRGKLKSTTGTRNRRVVNLTPAAITAIRAAQEAGKPFLRVGVLRQGPTGYMYDLKFDDRLNADDDYLDHVDEIKIVVDQRSAPYLEGTTIDWQTTPDGRQGFHFNNPNAKQ